MRHLQAAAMAKKPNEQIVKERQMKKNSCSFWTDSATVLQWMYSSDLKQEVCAATPLAGILDTTGVSQRKHVSGINNPSNTGTRAISSEKLKKAIGSVGRPV